MAKGFSQQRLGEDSGFERSYISDLERGTRNPSVQAVERLANALEVDPAELLKRMESEGGGDV